jgi:hypothetical protein
VALSRFTDVVADSLRAVARTLIQPIEINWRGADRKKGAVGTGCGQNLKRVGERLI